MRCLLRHLGSSKDPDLSRGFPQVSSLLELQTTLITSGLLLRQNLYAPHLQLQY